MAYPADPLKFDMIFNLSFLEYSEKNSSFLGITYPSIPNKFNFFFKKDNLFFIISTFFDI